MIVLIVTSEASLIVRLKIFYSVTVYYQYHYASERFLFLIKLNIKRTLYRVRQSEQLYREPLLKKTSLVQSVPSLPTAMCLFEVWSSTELSV